MDSKDLKHPFFGIIPSCPNARDKFIEGILLKKIPNIEELLQTDTEDFLRVNHNDYKYEAFYYKDELLLEVEYNDYQWKFKY